jgi:hypothetical protein
MVATAILGLIAAANPEKGSLVLRVIGGVLSLGGLLVGALLVVGLGI